VIDSGLSSLDLIIVGNTLQLLSLSCGIWYCISSQSGSCLKPERTSYIL